MTEAALDNFIESTKRTVMNTFPLSDMKDEALHDAIEDLVAENLSGQYIPLQQRAMIVEAGAGSAAGNAPIHAGPTGRSVWDDDVSGQHPSRAKSEYLLPAEFNQKGNQFVENTMRIMETAYGDITEFVFATVPDSAYYGNVQVSSR